MVDKVIKVGTIIKETLLYDKDWRVDANYGGITCPCGKGTLLWDENGQGSLYFIPSMSDNKLPVASMSKLTTYISEDADKKLHAKAQAVFAIIGGSRRSQAINEYLFIGGKIILIDNDSNTQDLFKKICKDQEVTLQIYSGYDDFLKDSLGIELKDLQNAKNEALLYLQDNLARYTKSQTVENYYLPIFFFGNDAGKNGEKSKEMLANFLKTYVDVMRNQLFLVWFSSEQIKSRECFDGILSKEYTKLETYGVWFAPLFQKYHQWLAENYENEGDQKQEPISDLSTKEGFGCLNPAIQVRNHLDKASHMLYSPPNLWDNGSTILVYFMDDSNSARNKIIFEIAKMWEKYVYITFKLAETDEEKGKAQIRIKFLPNEGSSSYVGKENLDIPKTEHTMNFGWFRNERDPKSEEYHRTTLHEFGHALGFFHELQNPFTTVPYDEKKVIDFYSTKWSEEKTRHNILDRLDKTPYFKSLRGNRKLDPKSIMCYKIEPKLLKDEYEKEYPINGFNHVLSMQDMYWALQAYPYPLQMFPLGARVKVKDSEDVLLYMTISQRDQIDQQINDYCNCDGDVILVHPVNGILVDFRNTSYNVNKNKMIWFEPRCLIRTDTVDKEGPYMDRIMPGTYVRIKNQELNKKGIKTGVVVLTPLSKCMGDEVMSYVYVNYDSVNGSQTEQVPIKDIEQATFLNEDINELDFVDIELVNFNIGQKVRVKDILDIQKAFEYADRNDCGEDQTSHANQYGNVDYLHKTNGVYVKFEDNKKVWFEPSCLIIESMQKYNQSIGKRILVRSVVIVQKRDTGLVQIQEKANTPKISVKIGDSVSDFDPEDVVLKSEYLNSKRGYNAVPAEGWFDSIVGTLKEGAISAAKSVAQKALEFGKEKGTQFIQDMIQKHVLGSQNAEEPEPEDNINQQDAEFFKNLARSVFGITSSDVVMLPIQGGGGLTPETAKPKDKDDKKEEDKTGENVDTQEEPFKLQDDITANVRMLGGIYSAKPRNSSYVPGSDIQSQLKMIFSLGSRGTQEIISKEDSTLSDELDKRIMSLIELETVYYNKYLQSGNKLYLASIETKRKQIALLQSQQREIFNKYGNAALGYFSQNFDEEKDKPIQLSPPNYADLINNYQTKENDGKYTKISYTHSFSKSKYSSSSTSIGASVSYLPFFSASFSKEKKTEDLSETFGTVTFSAKVFQGTFVRPWFNETLFSLENIQLSSFKEGTISNGLDLKNLNGNMCLIPMSFVVAKDVTLTFGSRNSSAHSQLDSYKGSAGISIGPFSFGPDVSHQKIDSTKSETANSVSFTTPAPQLFAVICSRLPKFPMKTSPLAQQNVEIIERPLMNMFYHQKWDLISDNFWEFTPSDQSHPRLRFNAGTKQIQIENLEKNMFLEFLEYEPEFERYSIDPSSQVDVFQEFSKLRYFIKRALNAFSTGALKKSNKKPSENEEDDPENKKTKDENEDDDEEKDRPDYLVADEIFEIGAVLQSKGLKAKYNKQYIPTFKKEFNGQIVRLLLAQEKRDITIDVYPKGKRNSENHLSIYSSGRELSDDISKLINLTKKGNADSKKLFSNILNLVKELVLIIEEAFSQKSQEAIPEVEAIETNGDRSAEY